MSKNKTWGPAGWPWELDLLSLIFIVIAVLIPYQIFTAHAADSALAANQAALKLKEQSYILWSIGLVALLLMHLGLAGVGDRSNSLPIIHLISPIIFAALAYYRILVVSQDLNQTFFVNGHASQIALGIIAVIVATFLVAKLRMARLMHRFRDTEWEMECDSAYDKSYFELIAQFRPLLYPPRRYRLCSEGILVEGWIYAVVIPFSNIQSINPVKTMGFSASGHYYASNTSSLVRLELLDSDDPMFISPYGRDEFLHYCAHHVARIRPSTHHRTRQGTNPGVTARDTHPGLNSRGTHAGERAPNA